MKRTLMIEKMKDSYYCICKSKCSCKLSDNNINCIWNICNGMCRLWNKNDRRKEILMKEEMRDFLYCIYEIQCSCKIVRQQGKLFVNTIKHVCSEMVNGTKRMFCAN